MRPRGIDPVSLLPGSFVAKGVSAAEAAAFAVDPNPQNIAAGRYIVDPTHTRVLFNVLHFGVGRYCHHASLLT